MTSSRAQNLVIAVGGLIAWLGVGLVVVEPAERPNLRGVNTLNDHYSYSHLIARTLRQRKYDELEAIIAELRKTRTKMPSGMSMIRSFYHGASRLDGERSDETCRRQIALLDAWRKAKPDSLAARIALAGVWRGYGWLSRGTSYASEVPPERWRIFQERLQKAIDLLDGAESEDDPELYHSLLWTARDSGESKERIYELLEKSIAVDPSYWHSFEAAAGAMLPQWQGGPGDVEQLALDVLEMTVEQFGHEMYARTAAAMRMYRGSAMFQFYNFDWDKVRQGFRDALKREPDSLFTMNQFCLLACYAGDRESAREMFEQIGGLWDMEMWPRESSYAKWYSWAQPDYLEGAQRLAFNDHSDSVYTVAFSPDGSLLASGSGDNQLRLRRLGTDEKQPRGLLHRENVMSIAFEPTGRRVATGGGSGQVMLWELPAGQSRLVHKHGERVKDLAFSPDGTYLASISHDGELRVWTGPDLNEPLDLPIDVKGGAGVSFSHDSERLAVMDNAGEVTVCELEFGGVIWSRRAHTRWGTSVAFSPDGKVLATSGSDRVVKLWKVVNGEPIANLPSGSNPLDVHDLAFSPDGTRLAGVTIANDAARPGQLLVWDVAHKAVLRRYNGHKAGVWGVAVSPAGDLIATAGYDMTVRLWAMPAPLPEKAKEE